MANEKSYPDRERIRRAAWSRIGPDIEALVEECKQAFGWDQRGRTGRLFILDIAYEALMGEFRDERERVAAYPPEHREPALIVIEELERETDARLMRTRAQIVGGADS